jgi:hypothetical protein
MEKNPLENWQNVIIIPVHKKGNIRDCENYSITLFNSGYKSHANLIKNKFYTYYQNKPGGQ